MNVWLHYITRYAEAHTQCFNGHYPGTLFRTQQRASLLEPGSSTTSLQFCVIFIGFQSGSVSVSSWLWWFTSACMHGLAPPSYLADVCTPVSSVVGCQLRSANSGTLVVPGTRATIGHHNFAMSGSECSEISCNVKWNVSLAMEIPDCVSFISG